MSKNESGACCAGEDIVTRTLGRVGVTRSMLWTLTLVPFAWEGVVWVGGAIEALWGLVTNAVN